MSEGDGKEELSSDSAATFVSTVVIAVLNGLSELGVVSCPMVALGIPCTVVMRGTIPVVSVVAVAVVAGVAVVAAAAGVVVTVVVVVVGAVVVVAVFVDVVEVGTAGVVCGICDVIDVISFFFVCVYAFNLMLFIL